MARIFLQTFVVPNLDENDRKKQLRWFARFRGAEVSDDCLNQVSGRCSGFLCKDLDALVGHAMRYVSFSKYTAVLFTAASAKEKLEVPKERAFRV